MYYRRGRWFSTLLIKTVIISVCFLGSSFKALNSKTEKHDCWASCFSILKKEWVWIGLRIGRWNFLGAIFEIYCKRREIIRLTTMRFSDNDMRHPNANNDAIEARRLVGMCSISFYSVRTLGLVNAIFSNDNSWHFPLVFVICHS